MVEIADIQDKESLEAWFDGLPRGAEAEEEEARRIMVWVAHRAAMRVAPVAWHAYTFEDWAKKHDLTAIPVLRSLLTSAVASTWPTADVRAAADATADAYAAAASADASADAAYAAAFAAAYDAAAAAAYAADAWSASKADFWVMIRQDCTIAVDTAEQDPAKLWFDHDIPSAWPTLRENLAAHPADWSFWIEWYEDALHGRAPNWKLLTEIALLPDDLWKGPIDDLNARISELQLKHAIAKTRNAEVMSINPDTGKLRVDPLTDMPDDRLRDAMDQLQDVIDLFAATPDHTNQHVALATEVSILRTALDRYATRPRMLHRSCVRVLARLTTKFDNGECPQPDQDADVGDLWRSTSLVAAEILTHDSFAAEAVADEDSSRIPAAIPDVPPELIDAVDIMAAASEDDLAVELPEDVRTAADPNASQADRRSALFSVASRFLHGVMFLGWIGNTEFVKEVAASTKTLAGLSVSSTVLWGTVVKPDWLSKVLNWILHIV